MAIAPVDLHEVVAHAVEEPALAFPQRRIDHVRAGAGPCQADANRVTQALGNLVANAVGYGRSDTGITVTSSVDPAGWQVRVHNWGAPIAPEALDRLFMPMVRGVAQDSGNRNVGLGLFIVNEIAKAHGGMLDVASTQEQGTEFTFGAPSSASGQHRLPGEVGGLSVALSCAVAPLHANATAPVTPDRPCKSSR